MKSPLCHGGFADVWKGEYRGREVAAKVLRIYSKNDPERIRRVGRWLCFRIVVFINDRPRLVEVLQGGCGLEDPPPPKCTSTARCDDVRGPARDGVGVDGEW